MNNNTKSHLPLALQQAFMNRMISIEPWDSSLKIESHGYPMKRKTRSILLLIILLVRLFDVIPRLKNRPRPIGRAAGGKGCQRDGK
ncbi:hypothetical protein N7471_002668 [Penicillium samsonianum]|uniref:uncharacterized protein n=1 Tax=Penicillium samsonianum TaxID=1882272 RepID=UPI002548C030|nr:uncharacterized protein N7471_002668 [Penicillium samsonianum]KAJ6143215.1 hypothetical protein N7471_002668 [Penicillium samsonianum]